MAEIALAELVPIWRTLRERAVTALVTPALDYVGGLELGTRDARFDSEDAIAAFGESLRSLVASLDDGCSLLFIYRVTADAEEEIRDYEQLTSSTEVAALRAFVEARADWLRGQRLRRTRLFLFFSLSGDALAGMSRGALGVRLAFANVEKLSDERHQKQLEELAQLRDRLVSRFAQAGLPARELAGEDVTRLHYDLLNPSRARQRLTPPHVSTRQDLFDEATLRAHPFLREYTEAEQLCHENIADSRGHFRQGDIYRRCLTLKLLPESGSDYFASEPLLSLAVQRGQETEPLAFTLAVAVQTLPQAKARFQLNARHQLVGALRNALPFLNGGRNVEHEATDAAHQHSIEALFAELTSMSTKLVTLSATLLLEADSLRELDAQTEAVRAAYNSIGNSELQVEDVAQIPAFLSMLPGSGAYQFRKKGCTSRNAGDFLPVFAAWRGCARAASVLQTPSGDVFRWDSFDRSVAAHHGFVAADTGSGKSVTLGALTLDALASGVDAILVDNGGFGKTYEALAVLTLLAEESRRRRERFERVLILCKSSLLPKWREEVSASRTDSGFPRYLTGKWARHPVRDLFDPKNVREISGRYAARALREKGERGVRLDQTVQVGKGIWIVNHNVLAQSARETQPLLRQLFQTNWDLVIVDEAHHYARKNTPHLLFAPNGNLRDYPQSDSLKFDRILCLTATPFELDPRQLVDLLGLIRADKEDLDRIETGLSAFSSRLDSFHELRRRSAKDELRRKTVEMLERIRKTDATGDGGNGNGVEGGLEALLRRYLIRNVKTLHERRYSLVSKKGDGYQTEAFDKLGDDLMRTLRISPLLPFDGPDALLYLELREAIAAAQEQSARSEDSDVAKEKKPFVSGDLRQGLSSYPQLAASALLQKKLPEVERLSRLLAAFDQGKERRLHPKVRALVGLVEQIARHELEQARNPGRWLSKVLVFNKLKRTATDLVDRLTPPLKQVFRAAADEACASGGWASHKSLASAIQEELNTGLRGIQERLLRDHGEWARVPESFNDDRLLKHVGQSLVTPFRESLQRRAHQDLFLLRAALRSPGPDRIALGQWLHEEVLTPFEGRLGDLARQVEAAERSGSDDDDGRTLRDAALAETRRLLEECRSVGLVGRYDGTNGDEREAHRRNFNDLFNPFVLIVSAIGEEGIDLQKQCKYILHYDLEWNPARMEQREGRVDREGWGGKAGDFIDVRFMLLKGTYEERIFQTVMQRDQWFQILMGAKKRELGKLPDDGSELADGEDGPEEESEGRLLPEERAKVMFDLRPR